MKTVFVINPKAGQGTGLEKLIQSIRNAANKLKADVEIYVTKAIGDAERYVREYCKVFGGARFIACGGDGTLGEVLNGAIEQPDSQIGVMLYGTGNDFRRNFGSQEDFLDVEAQITADCTRCDAIRYTKETDGKKQARYCANMFNIGFDCNVADLTAKMKTRPFISGSLAYFISIFAILIKKKGANLAIELDGREKHKGPLLLTAISNGKFCGGGLESNPLGVINDGLMDVNIVYNISRLNFLTKLPFYIRGTHIKLKNIENVIFSTKCKKIAVTPLNGKMRICVDGEIEDAERTEFEIVPAAFDFVVPKRMSKINENVLLSANM